MKRSTLHLFATVSVLALCHAAHAQDGFAIVLDGERIAGDAGVATTIAAVRPPFRSTADVTVVVDGLGVTPRLDLEVAGSHRHQRDPAKPDELSGIRDAG